MPLAIIKVLIAQSSPIDLLSFGSVCLARAWLPLGLSLCLAASLDGREFHICLTLLIDYLFLQNKLYFLFIERFVVFFLI